MYRHLRAICTMAVFSCLALVACNPGGDTKDSPESDTAKGVTSTPATPSSGNPFKPRFDGLYYTIQPDSTDHRHFVRYFKDGTVCKTFDSATASPNKVSRWLTPDGVNADDECTTYDPSGSFTTNGGKGDVEYTLKNFSDKDNTFDLYSVSHIKGYEGAKPPKHFQFSQD